MTTSSIGGGPIGVALSAIARGAILAALLAAAPLQAQESSRTGPRGMICDDGYTTLPVLRVGQTIGIETEEGERLEGPLLSCSGTVLVIEAADSMRLVDARQVVRLEVGYPIENRAKGFLRGALIGGVAGGVLAGVIGREVFDDCPEYVTCDLSLLTLYAALFGFGAGAFLGGVIGAEDPPLARMDWEPVTVRMSGP